MSDCETDSTTVSESVSDSVSASATVSESDSTTVSESDSDSVPASATVSESDSATVSESASDSDSVSDAVSDYESRAALGLRSRIPSRRMARSLSLNLALSPSPTRNAPGPRMLLCMPPDNERLVFERRVWSQALLLGFALVLGLAGLMTPPLEGARLKEGLIVLACFCLGFSGFRSVFVLNQSLLTSGLRWFRWDLPSWLRGKPSAGLLGELRALRCGRSFSSTPGAAWSVDVITSQSRVTLEYGSEAMMQSDLDAVPVLERSVGERNSILGMAAFHGICALISLPFGDASITVLCVLATCLFLCLAGFRVTYALTGARLTETVRWYGWRFPTLVRARLPTGAGMLRAVVYARPFKTRWRVVMHTSGGAIDCTYRDEALMQADLDELRALCPRVPIVMR